MTDTFSEVRQGFDELVALMRELNNLGPASPLAQLTPQEIYESGWRNADFHFITRDWTSLLKAQKQGFHPADKQVLVDLTKRIPVAGGLAKALIARIRARQAHDEFMLAVERLEKAVLDAAEDQTTPPYVPGPNNPLIYPPGGAPGVQPGGGGGGRPDTGDPFSSTGGGPGPLAVDWTIPAGSVRAPAGPFAVTWDLDGPPVSPQARDRAAIAARQGGGHGDEFFFGLPGGGTLLSKLKGPGRGPGMDAFASLARGPRDMNTYAHGKKPGPMGPDPGAGKGTSGTTNTVTARGPNPSGMASANNPASGRSTDRDQGFAKVGPVDRGPSGSTVVGGTSGGGSGGMTPATARPTVAPNPPADKSSGGTTTKPTTPGPNPTPDKSSGGTTTTTTKGGGGGGGTTSPAPPGGGGSKGPAKSEPTKPVETKSDHKKEPPPPPPPPDDHPRRHGSNPNPEDDDRGGGGGPRASGGHNENPNPEDTGGGGRGVGGPRAYGGQNQNPNPEDQGHGGGIGPRAYGAFSRSNLAGPRSYDAYPDPESTGGGGPRGRYNERPNPEDTGSPHGPSARNRNAIAPWSASRNRMI